MFSPFPRNLQITNWLRICVSSGRSYEKLEVD